ncbi:TetR/AcrR family transcriptional regulator [Rhodococcus coprophilus]|uniref:TetR family transcriptional regulator n=1 Tax=Rhodococcus coprophilus TaxID=38310 RepID=A0A2X4U306_9NOCA|nr:TetR family transcriptional regulator [Rhodococcus coprophilus]MBM7458771.1 DNA-binding transcriptional regulator YbjK [Rhodococcus coprophilus]SQI33431.1 TetR family transcriptional regulator [Rhodococcus coprophilus]
MTDKRAAVLDAAIEVLGTEGVRALTHRRVDARAGVPAGSTSNYFRTRGALVEGVLDRLLQADRRDLAVLTAGGRAPDRQGLEDLLRDYVLYATGPDAVKTRARLALFVESTTVPALRASVGARRGELRDWGAGILAALGADDPEAAARIVVDYLDGVILHRLTSADGEDDGQTDPQVGIGRVLDAVLPRTPVM